MRTSRSAFHLISTSMLGLLVYSGSIQAEQTTWWQRADIYAALGVSHVEAAPETGGSIGMSFDDSSTPTLDKSLIGGEGLDSRHYLPSGTLGARIHLTQRLSWGVEMHRYSFSDAESAVPLDAPGVTPLPNSATFLETSTFKLKAHDLAATVRYSRWNVTLDGLYGERSGSFLSTSSMDAFGVFTASNFINMTLANGSSFKGDGQLYGFGLSIGVPRTTVSLFGRYKRADLEGRSNSFARAVGTVASPTSPPLVGASTVTRNNARAESIIQDYEYGLQFDFIPSEDGVQSFVRLSYLETRWELNGLPTGSSGFGGTIGNLTADSFANAGLGKATLRGYGAAVGVMF
ncbi:MAG: hypothetical protein ACK4SX_14565 [Alcanivoracaceae bacterium]